MVFAFGQDLKIDQLISDFVLMARDRNEDHERNQGKKGKFPHGDGWGAAFSKDGSWELIRSTKPCFEDQNLQSLKSIKTPAIMLHARRASVGAVAVENTHPFEGVKDETKYLFCHNGNVGEGGREKFRRLFKPKGDTDSERLFSHILSGEISKEGIKKSLSVFENYLALNFILVGGGRLFAATWFKETGPLYYQMKILRIPPLTIISSEVLKSFGEEGDWKKIKNKDIIEETLSF